MTIKGLIFRAESEGSNSPERARTSVDLDASIKRLVTDGYQDTTLGRRWGGNLSTRNLRFLPFIIRVET